MLRTFDRPSPIVLRVLATFVHGFIFPAVALALAIMSWLSLFGTDGSLARLIRNYDVAAFGEGPVLIDSPVDVVLSGEGPWGACALQEQRFIGAKVNAWVTQVSYSSGRVSIFVHGERVWVPVQKLFLNGPLHSVPTDQVKAYLGDRYKDIQPGGGRSVGAVRYMRQCVEVPAYVYSADAKVERDKLGQWVVATGYIHVRGGPSRAHELRSVLLNDGPGLGGLCAPIAYLCLVWWVWSSDKSIRTLSDVVGVSGKRTLGLWGWGWATWGLACLVVASFAIFTQTVWTPWLAWLAFGALLLAGGRKVTTRIHALCALRALSVLELRSGPAQLGQPWALLHQQVLKQIRNRVSVLEQRVFPDTLEFFYQGGPVVLFPAQVHLDLVCTERTDQWPQRVREGRLLPGDPVLVLGSLVESKLVSNETDIGYRESTKRVRTLAQQAGLTPALVAGTHSELKARIRSALRRLEFIRMSMVLAWVVTLLFAIAVQSLAQKVLAAQ
jgi:hypothetical protein